MNKETYLKPDMQVVNINMSHQLLSGSPLATKTAGNAGFNENIYSGTGSARSSSFGEWDDEE